MWEKIELACKAADLVAADRRAVGRPAGKAGTLRERYENCARDIAAGFRRLSDALTRAGF